MLQSTPQIILASTSKYRKRLIESIGLSPTCISPDCDESTIDESLYSPLEVAEKRAELKAQSIPLDKYPDSVILGSDQLVNLDGEVLGKPGSLEKACQQLQKMRGKTHELITSVCFVQKEKQKTFTNITRLTLFDLSDEEIQKYVELDQPTDCAGSYKIEEHGMWLFEKIETDDWSAIQGLPLQTLIRFLREST